MSDYIFLQAVLYDRRKNVVWTNPDFPDSLVKAQRPRPEQGFDSLALMDSLAVVEDLNVVEDRQPCVLSAMEVRCLTPFL